MELEIYICQLKFPGSFVKSQRITLDDVITIHDLKQKIIEQHNLDKFSKFKFRYDKITIDCDDDTKLISLNFKEDIPLLVTICDKLNKKASAPPNTPDPDCKKY